MWGDQLSTARQYWLALFSLVVWCNTDIRWKLRKTSSLLCTAKMSLAHLLYPLPLHSWSKDCLPPNLLFSRLNKARCLSPWLLHANLPIILVAFTGLLPIYILPSGAQNWAQDSSCSLGSAEQSGGIAFLAPAQLCSSGARMGLDTFIFTCPSGLPDQLLQSCFATLRSSAGCTTAPG